MTVDSDRVALMALLQAELECQRGKIAVQTLRRSRLTARTRPTAVQRGAETQLPAPDRQVEAARARGHTSGHVPEGRAFG
jgi:hypothetical protein